MVFNATFNNISVTSWLSVLLVEEQLMQINYFPNMTNNFTNLEGITSFSLCLTTSTRRRRHLLHVLFGQLKLHLFINQTLQCYFNLFAVLTNS
jgi:hypothetical protein